MSTPKSRPAKRATTVTARVQLVERIVQSLTFGLAPHNSLLVVDHPVQTCTHIIDQALLSCTTLDTWQVNVGTRWVKKIRIHKRPMRVSDVSRSLQS